jgi:hypothetical protein
MLLHCTCYILTCSRFVLLLVWIFCISRREKDSVVRNFRTTESLS